MDLHDLTIAKTKEKLKKKEFSATELTKAYLKRIKELEPQLNAFVTITEERALLDAKRADELIENGQDLPLLGLPFSIKDNFNTKGIRTTASSKVLRDYISPYNATVVERLENAGAVILGKTNLDAWGHGSSTETSDYNPSKNPWDLTRLPGGSSGGSASAVSADESLFAIGTETAGSIRLPSSWCGIVGLKPTYGRVSRYGVIAMASSTDSPGPLTKSVEDAALILEVLAGIDPFDATSLPNSVNQYTTRMKKPRKLTIGIAKEYFENVDGEIVSCVEKAITILKKNDHIVKQIELFDPQYAVDVYTILQRAEVSSNLARMDGIRFGNKRSFFNEESERRIMLGTFVLSSGYFDAYYAKAQKVRTLIIEDFAKAFEKVDVIIGPTTSVTALPIGSAKNNPISGEKMDRLMEPSSIAGLCALTIPVGFSKNKLPIGMQLIGPQFGEETIFSLAYQYEKEMPFLQYQPPL